MEMVNFVGNCTENTVDFTENSDDFTETLVISQKTQKIGLIIGSFANYLRPEVVVDYKNNMFANVLYLEYFYGSEEFPDYIWNGNNLNGLISDDDMEILKSSKPDDNPIIVLFKLKSEI